MTFHCASHGGFKPHHVIYWEVAANIQSHDLPVPQICVNGFGH